MFQLKCVFFCEGVVAACWLLSGGNFQFQQILRYYHQGLSLFILISYIFQARYIQAKLSVHDRSLKVASVIESLEMEMELLCLTGVEDQLQTDVRPTLEILRNAGIKVWPADGLISTVIKPVSFVTNTAEEAPLVGDDLHIRIVGSFHFNRN